MLRVDEVKKKRMRKSGWVVVIFGEIFQALSER